MKYLKMLAFVWLLFGKDVIAQNKKNAVLKVQTSAECEQCKKRIESNLVYEKGIKFCKLDVPSKIATITYNAEKISPEEIRIAISKLGYSADGVPAEKKAYDALPECCKNGSLEHK